MFDFFNYNLIQWNVNISGQLQKSPLSQQNWDPEQMRQNLTTHPHNVKNDFTNFHLSQGGTKENARTLMRFLWTMVPVALVASFASLMLGLALMSKSYNEAVKSLVKDEVARDMRRVKRRYLRSSAQVNNFSDANLLISTACRPKKWGESSKIRHEERRPSPQFPQDENLD